MSANAPNAAESRIQPQSSSPHSMTEAELANATWWAWFWGEIEHWAFLLVVVFLAIEFAALKLAAPSKEKIDRARQERLSELATRAAEAELKLEQLRKMAGPRDIVDRDAFNRALEGKPKSRVEFWYLPYTSDGYWFANRLANAVGVANWEWTPPIPFPETKPDPDNILSRFVPPQVVAGAQASGVTVVGASADEPSSGEINPSKWALMQAISAGSGWGAFGSASDSVPKGTLRVIIAAKPDPIFANPPATATPENAK